MMVENAEPAGKITYRREREFPERTSDRMALDPDMRRRRSRLRKVVDRLAEIYPTRNEYREGTLSFVDTLVAIILSQNTSDVNSHRAYLQLRAAWSGWEEVAMADPEEIAGVIAVSGLAAQKSRAIHGALHGLLERWGDFGLEGIGEEEDDDLLAFLTSIPGIGVKSASCAMMFALDRDLCAVDTHIHRVLNRIGIVAASSADRTFRELRPLLPSGRAREIHVMLIRFGRDICKARGPHCFECPVYDLCGWEEKEDFARNPRPGPKPVSGDFLITDGL